MLHALAVPLAHGSLLVEQPVNDIFVMNDQVALGMNSHGNWGTRDSRDLTSHFRETIFHTQPKESSMGIVVNLSEHGDFFLPGTQFESWAFGPIDGPHTYSSRTLRADLTNAKGTTLNYTADDAGASIVFSATSPEGDLALDYHAFIGADEADTIPVEVTLTNHGPRCVNAYYSRAVDADTNLPNDAETAGRHLTRNTVVTHDRQAGGIVKADGKLAGGGFAFASFEANTSVDNGYDHLLFRPWKYERPSVAPQGHSKDWDRPIAIAMEYPKLCPGEQQTKTYYMILTSNLTAALAFANDVKEAENVDRVTVHGDPLFKFKGKAAHFWLAPGATTKLLEWRSADGHNVGEKCTWQLMGKTFDHKHSKNQWFNQFVIMQDNATVLDVAVNSWQTNGGTMQVLLDGRPMEHAVKKGAVRMFASEKPGLNVSIKKRPGRLDIGHKSAEKLLIDAGGLKLSIYSAKAAKFTSRKAQAKYMHLNIAFDHGITLPATGVLAQLSGVEAMSNATTDMLKRPHPIRGRRLANATSAAERSARSAQQRLERALSSAGMEVGASALQPEWFNATAPS
jgi:hypothetical protein